MTDPDRLRELALHSLTQAGDKPRTYTRGCLHDCATAILALLDRQSAAELARDEAYAKSAALLEMSNGALLLMAGEMTAGELRTVRAVLKSLANGIRALSPRTKEQRQNTIQAANVTGN